MMSPAQLTPHQACPSRVSLDNLVAFSSRRIVYKNLSLHLKPIGRPPRPEALLGKLDFDGFSIALAIEDFEQTSKTDFPVSHDNFQKLPDELRAALTGAWVQETGIVDALFEATAFSLEPDVWQNIEKPISYYFEITGPDGTVRSQGILAISDDDKETFSAWFGKKAETRETESPHAIRLDYTAGWTDLSPKEYQLIEPLDIILLQQGSPLYKKRICISFEGKKVFEIDSPYTVPTLMSIMTEESESQNHEQDVENSPANEPSAESPQVPASVISSASIEKEISLRITFELGSQEITLKEFTSLKPGYVFPLSTPVTGFVNICFQGKTIGQGQLVQVSDRLGVRITDWK